MRDEEQKLWKVINKGYASNHPVGVQKRNKIGQVTSHQKGMASADVMQFFDDANNIK